MPAGEDKIRARYSYEGKTHPNRKSKKKTGFEGNNWPSTRTFYSDISIEVIMMVAKFRFYLKLTGLLDDGIEPCKRALEHISRNLGHYVSNYTTEGLLNEKWGPRHKPTRKTIANILYLTEWLEKKSRQLGIWKPFKFKPHKEDNPNKPKHEKESRYKGIVRQESSRKKESSGGVELSHDNLPYFRQKGRRGKVG